jgi:hypothetical protein
LISLRNLFGPVFGPISQRCTARQAPSPTAASLRTDFPAGASPRLCNFLPTGVSFFIEFDFRKFWILNGMYVLSPDLHQGWPPPGRLLFRLPAEILGDSACLGSRRTFPSINPSNCNPVITVSTESCPAALPAAAGRNSVCAVSQRSRQLENAVCIIAAALAGTVTVSALRGSMPASCAKSAAGESEALDRRYNL